MNKRLKGSSDGKYPVYVRVIYNRQNTNFRSEILTTALLDDGELEKSAKVKREIEYETQIISSIIGFAVHRLNDNFSISNLNTIISEWKYDLADVFTDEYLSHKKVSKSIHGFICSKTGIDISTTEAITGIIDLDVKSLLKLAKLGIFENLLNDYVTYAYLLEQFSEIHYPDQSSRYGADNTFNFLEWYELDGKRKFVKYANSKGLLTESKIFKITEVFETYLIDKQLNEISFWKDFKVSERN